MCVCVNAAFQEQVPANTASWVEAMTIVEQAKRGSTTQRAQSKVTVLSHRFTNETPKGPPYKALASFTGRSNNKHAVAVPVTTFGDLTHLTEP